MKRWHSASGVWQGTPEEVSAWQKLEDSWGKRRQIGSRRVTRWTLAGALNWSNSVSLEA
jgi:hypothetical protein